MWRWNNPSADNLSPIVQEVTLTGSDRDEVGNNRRGRFQTETTSFDTTTTLLTGNILLPIKAERQFVDQAGYTQQRGLFPQQR